MAEKVSIIIPNYNGQDLLARNLPYVIKHSPGSQIIVIDDASTDKSVMLVHKKFKKIKVIKLKKNVGFAKAVNVGLKYAKGDFLVLLNTDVLPQRDYLKPAIKHFSRSKNLFAVGFLDYSHENGKTFLKGRGRAYFKKGFILHKAGIIERGETFWVSGGSGLFDREKLLQLGGFDPLFAPFYWEDIDLCFRAAKHGYFCLFEPLSVVDHYHDLGAINRQKSKFFIKTVAYKNQFIFFWKNVSNVYMCALHIVWLPYHLLRALLKLDLAFLAGLAWAMGEIPALVTSSFYSKQDCIISELEVLNKYQKQ